MRSILLIDVGGEPMELLATLVQRLDYRALRAKTTEEALQRLADPRFAIGCAVVPPDPPVPDLGRAITALRGAARSPDLPFLVAGSRRTVKVCHELAAAGVRLALWEPFDPHTLRFQLNRALAGAESFRRRRSVARAPARLRVVVHARGRSKETSLYTLSSDGAFLATQLPSLRGTDVQLELPIVRGRVGARVVMTNVPGNLMKKSLPPGMAVRFERLRVDEQAAIELHVERALRRLQF